MAKRQEDLVRRLKMFFDATVLFVSVLLAYSLRLYLHIHLERALSSADIAEYAVYYLEHYQLIFFLWIALWVLVLGLSGAYRSFRTYSFSRVFWIIVRSTFLFIIAFSGIVFLLKIKFVGRLFFALFIAIGFCLLIIEKRLLVFGSRYIRRKGYNLSRVLLVGTGPRAERFIAMLKDHSEWGFKVVGLIDAERSRVDEKFFGYKVVGVLDDIPQILSKKTVDEVIFVVPRTWLHDIQQSITDCETQGVRATVAADLFDVKIGRAQQTSLNGFPLLSFETTRGKEWQLFVKRIIDVVVSAVGLILCFPLFITTALLVKLTASGPVFFKQRRRGLYGRVFTMYKFRSMYVGAQRQREELAHLNEMDGPVFKIKNDPRITPLGRILRKTSIDELPQLFNVFMGRMSLVGPRPLPVGEVAKFKLWQRRRMSMRPELTCLWQISGRNKIGFSRWVELDLEYIDSWSLWLDVKILSKTVPVVLFGVGAR